MTEFCNLKLRPIKLKDVNDLYEYGSCKKTTQFLSWDYYKNINQAYSSLRYLMNRNLLTLAIENKKLFKMIGTISIVKIINNSIYIGYVLNKKFHNQGIMTWVVKEFMKILIVKYPNFEIYAEVLNQNLESLKVLKNNNFKIVKEIKIKNHELCYDGKLLKFFNPNFSNF